VATALSERAKLRATHPDLLADAKLTNLGPALAAAAVAVSKPTEYAVKGETTESRGEVVGQLALTAAPHEGRLTIAGGGPTKVIVFDGSAWARTNEGPLRWRRPIGSGPTAFPVSSDGGTLLVDAFRKELLAVDATTGRLNWRHSLPGQAAGAPVVLGPRIYITTISGQVLAIDVSTGNGLAQVQLPQSASVGLAVAGEFLVQVADEGLVYLLSSANLGCLDAAYLGHEPGSVTHTAANVSKIVVVPVNRWPTATTLRPIVMGASGKFGEIGAASEVLGLLVQPFTNDGGKLTVATDHGKTTTFEPAADPAEGLKQIAVADTPADSVAGPPNIPVVGIVPGPSADAFMAIAATGTASEVKLADLTGFVARQLSLPNKDAQPAVNIASVLPLASGGALLVPAGQPAELRVLESGTATARAIPLPGSLASPPVLWRDGLAVACTSGTIAWLDPGSGALKADPLQINLLPGEQLRNCRLVAGGKDDGELIVAHSGGTVLRVGLATEPLSQLVELGSVKIEGTISGLVASENVVGVLDRRGVWHTLALPDLSPASAASLAGRSIVAGPVHIGNLRLVATDSDELVALGDSLSPTWKSTLTHGPLAGNPAADGSTILVATQSGWLARIAPDSGSETAALNLHQPLAGSPVVVGGQVLVVAADGTLLSVSLAALEGKP
jgi:outer membrane protein assembly factor BamB